MEGNSAFYNLKTKNIMAQFNALLDVLQQLIAAICGVYYNEKEDTLFVIRPWTGDSELGLFNTLFFNEGSAQLRVVVEEYSKTLFREQSNDLISFNTLTKSFQPLDLESNKGDLNGFSKVLNSSKRIWGLKEYEKILENFLQGERFDFSTYDISGEYEDREFSLAYFPGSVAVFGYNYEKRYWEFYRIDVPNTYYGNREGDLVVNTGSQERDIEEMAKRFVRVLLQPIEETAE